MFGFWVQPNSRSRQLYGKCGFGCVCECTWTRTEHTAHVWMYTLAVYKVHRGIKALINLFLLPGVYSNALEVVMEDIWRWWFRLEKAELGHTDWRSVCHWEEASQEGLTGPTGSQSLREDTQLMHGARTQLSNELINLGLMWLWGKSSHTV